jgi:hypothetical protein
VSPVKYEQGFYIPEADILQASELFYKLTCGCNNRIIMYIRDQTGPFLYEIISQMFHYLTRSAYIEEVLKTGSCEFGS